jgi:hypothetical protein
MKINEVTQFSTKTLFETIHHDNTSGFLTEDLVKIAQVEKDGEWSKSMTADDLLDEMDSW